MQRLSNGFLFALAIGSCPCHAPLLLLLAGTTAGALLAAHTGLLVAAMTGVFAGALALGLRRTKQAADTPHQTPVAAPHQPTTAGPR